jgi:hypothetical protein
LKTHGSGYGVPQPLRDREIESIRSMFDSANALFVEGVLPSNHELRRLLFTVQNALEGYTHAYRHIICKLLTIRHAFQQHISQDTHLIVGALEDFVDVLLILIDERNDDEILQRFVHHSVLASRALVEQRRRVKLRRSSLAEMVGTEEPVGPETNLVALFLRLLGNN